MSDPSKVLLFGSFSEDETRSLLNQKPSNAHKPEERKESSVNLPNLGLMFGSFSDIPDTQVGFPSGPGDTNPSTIQKGNQQFIQKPATETLPIPSVSTIQKGNQQFIQKPATETLPVPSVSTIQKGNQQFIQKPASETLPIPSVNGNVKNSTHYVHGNEVVVGSNFRALQVSDDNDKIDGKIIPEIRDYEGLKLNGTVNAAAVETHHKEAHLKTDVPILDAQGITPRGLVNSGNLCFLNATLQALLACSPFVQLLLGLRKRNIPKVGYPTLTAFAEFIGEFDVVVGTNIKKKDSVEIEAGRPFNPTMFEVVLRNFTPDVSCSTSGRPRQEDAQEFLSFIMDQMNDELLKLGGKSYLDGRNPTLVSTWEDDEWETVGPKNKSAVTRTQSFFPSELSSIFGGELRSVVKAKGTKPSATVQPFRLLHLDISSESIRTIEDALRLFSAKETLDEYRASTAGKVGVVAARKSINIQTLPKIMILHLKRFSYGSHGSTKLHKAVHFPLELALSRDLLVSSNVEGRRYELVATVTHHGREASKGHYTADVRHPNGQWLRFDDASLTTISTSKVLHEQAYLLFYKQL
ncbi:ubiquitin carboxyl-terminal hydrolase 24-like isoform X2 [Salvia miltiorrhiza]|uniref:ubiquitin carboxyl-terminal hydrolase 24-like isoform X2 n=1 Tax=Salvia miltiorrhiza TaxID=226208 RepID=UPI0025AD9175|nr:ubiquitin carboxyl-terminal hydrolase 24-like isoform X2 [Salvia miltiorrhiza]